MFQELEREPLVKVTTHIDTLSFEAVLKRLKLRMKRVSSDEVLRIPTPLTMSHFDRVFDQTRSRISTRTLFTSNFASRFWIQSAQMIDIENKSLGSQGESNDLRKRTKMIVHGELRAVLR